MYLNDCAGVCGGETGNGAESQIRKSDMEELTYSYCAYKGKAMIKNYRRR